MNQEDFAALQRGDIIQHVTGNEGTYVVAGNYGDRVTAVKTADLTNPSEWEIVLKTTHRRV